MRAVAAAVALTLFASSALAFDPAQNAPLDDEFEPIVVGGKKYDTTYYTDPSKPGRGDREVKRGDSATVHVVAKIRDTGRVIMNTREAGMVPYAGVFGANGVIKGWDVAMMGARVAERRIVRVPAHEAFGAEGDKHLGVPGGSDLELDLTILQIRANKGKIRDESRGAPPPKEGEEDTAHIFGEEPRWPDEL